MMKNSAPPSIPVVYVYFTGALIKNIKGEAEWESPTQHQLPRYLLYTVSSSALNNDVVVLTHKRFRSAFNGLPEHILSRIQVEDLLMYVDEDLFDFSTNTYIQSPHRSEPWQEHNFTRWFVLKSWMKRNRVPYAAYSDGDNAVLSKVLFPDRNNKKAYQNNSPFGGVILWNDDKNNYVEAVAWAGAGGVLSSELVEDFVNFIENAHQSLEVVEWLKKRCVAKQSIGDMVFWNLYRVCSVDAQGNGFYKKGITTDLSIPNTRGLRLYNGLVVSEISHGRVFDNKAGYKQKGFNIDRSGAHIRANAKSGSDQIELLKTNKYTGPEDSVIELNNIHFRSKHKKNIARILQAFISFEPYDQGNFFSGKR